MFLGMIQSGSIESYDHGVDMEMKTQTKFFGCLFLLSVMLSACDAADPQLPPKETAQSVDAAGPQPTKVDSDPFTATPAPAHSPLPNLTEAPATSQISPLVPVLERKVTETLIYTFESGIPKSLHFSPDEQHFAFVVGTEDGDFVIVDGEEQQLYEEVPGHTLEFSPDSQRLVYQVEAGDKEFYVVDGVEQKPYDFVSSYTFFSPDSQHFAYDADEGDENFIVVDGVEQKLPGGSYSSPLFSPDSQHLAHAGYNDETGSFIVRDGVEGKAYEHVGASWFSVCLFSPDSQHLAYKATENGAEFIVLDGYEHQGYTEVGSPHFSPDSQHLAYWAQDAGKEFFVLDETEQPPYDEVLSYTFTFSPDSQHTAYWASSDDEYFVVLDGQEGRPWRNLDLHIDYFIFADWTPPTFSPDSQRLAYDVIGEKIMAVEHGAKENEYDASARPVFSPDSRHIAYLAIKGDQGFVVIDESEGEPYDDLSPQFFFSPDSRYLAYIAWKNDQVFVVVNGHEGKAYDEIYRNAVIFDEPDKLHYYVIQGNALYRVEEELSSQE